MKHLLALLIVVAASLHHGCSGMEGAVDPRCEALKQSLASCGLNQPVPAEAACSEAMLQAHESLGSADCQSVQGLLDNSKADWFDCGDFMESCWLFFCCLPDDAQSGGDPHQDPGPASDSDSETTNPDGPGPDSSPAQDTSTPEPDSEFVSLILIVKNPFGVGLANAQVIVFGAYGPAAFTGTTDAAGQVLVLLPRGSYRVQVRVNYLAHEYSDVEAPGTRSLVFPYSY